MCIIADKISEQLAIPSDKKFPILAITEEVYKNKFVWEIGIHGNRLYFVDNYVHLHKLAKQMDANRMYGRTLYYMWNKEILYPCFDMTISRMITKEMEKHKLFNEMVDIVHKDLGYHIKDYPYHDIQFVIDTKAQAPFIWLVGRNTTYLCRMDGVEDLKILIQKIDAVPDIRHSYKSYIYDGTVLKKHTLLSTVRKDAARLLSEMTENEYEQSN